MNWRVLADVICYVELCQNPLRHKVVKIIMESMDNILHSAIKRWGSVAAEEVYVDPHPTYPCHLRYSPLKPFPQNLHSISRKWFGRISPAVSNACERVNRDFLDVSLLF